MNLRPILSRRTAAEATVEPLVDTIIEFGGAVAESVDKDYNPNNPRAERHLKNYMTERVGWINTTTRDAVHKAVASDNPRMAVRKVFKHAIDHRAVTIATTEVARTSNWSALDAGRWVADLKTKIWASQEDDRVRHDHVGLHGQRRKWLKKYEAPSGDKGLYPGDFALPESNIGCRCASLAGRKDQRKSAADYGDAVELYEGVRQPYYDAMIEAWRGEFQRQEKAVLAALGDA